MSEVQYLIITSNDKKDVFHVPTCCFMKVIPVNTEGESDPKYWKACMHSGEEVAINNKETADIISAQIINNRTDEGVSRCSKLMTDFAAIRYNMNFLKKSI